MGFGHYLSPVGSEHLGITHRSRFGRIRLSFLCPPAFGAILEHDLPWFGPTRRRAVGKGHGTQWGNNVCSGGDAGSKAAQTLMRYSRGRRIAEWRVERLIIRRYR